jgi:hypothetical protein
MAAAGAHDPTVTQPPAPTMAALRADESLGPAQPMEVVPARGIGPEPGLELAERPRVVHTATGTFHRQRLLRLNGEPEGNYCTASGERLGRRSTAEVSVTHRRFAAWPKPPGVWPESPRIPGRFGE